MTQHNTLNVKLSYSQLNKFGIKKIIEITLKFSSNVVGNSNDKNNLLHRLLLTNAQVSKLRKAFANDSSAIKLSKTQLHKIGQSEGFFRIIIKNWIAFNRKFT